MALLAVVELLNGWNGLRAQIRAHIPAQDIRNTIVPNTDTHFTMPVYRSLAEWESRKAHLRKQILAAAGRSRNCQDWGYSPACRQSRVWVRSADGECERARPSAVRRESVIKPYVAQLDTTVLE